MEYSISVRCRVCSSLGQVNVISVLCQATDPQLEIIASQQIDCDVTFISLQVEAMV